MKNKETCPQRMSRKAGNAWIQVHGIAQKSRHVAQAKLKTIELQKQKRQFGIKYMDLLDKGASEEELMRCIENSRENIQSVRDDINEAQATAASIDESTKQRIFIRSLGAQEGGTVRLKRGSKRMPGHGNFVAAPSVTFSDAEGPTFAPQPTAASGGAGSNRSTDAPAEVGPNIHEPDFVVVEPSAPLEELLENQN